MTVDLKVDPVSVRKYKSRAESSAPVVVPSSDECSADEMVLKCDGK